MNIDITALNLEGISRIDIDGEVNIPEELYINTDIVELDNVKFDGYLEAIEGEITLKGNVNGTMKINDAISLELLDYDFNAEIDEEIENFQENSTNTLDITEVLWQNIMLEVPLKLTHVESFDEYHGDGWKLVSEDSIENTNNPFKELKDMLGEE